MSGQGLPTCWIIGGPNDPATATRLETDMMQTPDYETKALDALTRAVARALEHKRRLGQYAVVWREDRPVCIGPDAPAQCDQTCSEGTASSSKI